MKLKPVKIPEKLSTWLAHALADLRKCERSKRYKVDMDHWHTPNGKCRVCLAGAVLAQSAGADPKESIEPFDCQGNDLHQFRESLHALNAVRMGDVATGIAHFRDDFARYRTSALNRDMPVYDHDHAAWWKAMRTLLADMRKAGL